MYEAETKSKSMVEEQYVRGDCCYAIVTGHNSKGSYLELDNGQPAFAYTAGNVREGVKILCTIAKSATAEKNALARLESNCSLYDMCA